MNEEKTEREREETFRKRGSDMANQKEEIFGWRASIVRAPPGKIIRKTPEVTVDEGFTVDE